MKRYSLFAGLFLQILALSYSQAQTADVKIEKIACRSISSMYPAKDLVEVTVASKNFSSSENAVKLLINFGDGKDTVAYACLSGLMSDKYLYSVSLQHKYTSGLYQIQVIAEGADEKKDIASNRIHITSNYTPISKFYLSKAD